MRALSVASWYHSVWSSENIRKMQNQSELKLFCMESTGMLMLYFHGLVSSSMQWRVGGAQNTCSIKLSAFHPLPYSDMMLICKNDHSGTQCISVNIPSSDSNLNKFIKSKKTSLVNISIFSGTFSFLPSYCLWVQEGIFFQCQYSNSTFLFPSKYPTLMYRLVASP